MPVCGRPGWSDSAHEASRALLVLGFDLRNMGVGNCDECHHPVRVHDVGKWASKYPSVDKLIEEGTFLVYQVRDIVSQGHVFVYSGGKYSGNGYYTWEEDSTKGKITTNIYRLE